MSQLAPFALPARRSYTVPPSMSQRHHADAGDGSTASGVKLFRLSQSCAATDRIISSTMDTLQSPRIVPPITGANFPTQDRESPSSFSLCRSSSAIDPSYTVSLAQPKRLAWPGPVHLKGTQDRSMGWFVQPLNHGVPTCRFPLPLNQSPETCAYLKSHPGRLLG